jgi:two-component system, chemotaxis family, chemotaxis protein CheY
MDVNVMVVDDSLMVRQQVGGALKRAGFGIVEAQDGSDALEKLAGSEGVALIVLDINMPRMGGLEFLEELRSSGKHNDVPVVMLTTEGQPRLMQQAKALGAKGWIIKPFKEDLLVAAVQRLTKAAPRPISERHGRNGRLDMARIPLVEKAFGRATGACNRGLERGVRRVERYIDAR